MFCVIHPKSTLNSSKMKWSPTCFVMLLTLVFAAIVSPAQADIIAYSISSSSDRGPNILPNLTASGNWQI